MVTDYNTRSIYKAYVYWVIQVTLFYIACNFVITDNYDLHKDWYFPQMEIFKRIYTIIQEKGIKAS